MPSYLRSILPGGTFFFTVVTFNRQPILTSPQARAILHAAWATIQSRYPFIIEAICLLPEHLHCIWTLPEGDANYSLRWSEIKKFFSHQYRKQILVSESPTTSRNKRGEATLWQRRFWEHTIRDQEDFKRHLDYIHYNPVKHGLVDAVRDWEWSSFHRYVKMGVYEPEWGSGGVKFENEIFGE
jgi:putative transposase